MDFKRLGRVFFGGIALGAVLAASGQALAGHRLLPASSHCYKFPYLASVYTCGIPVGTDFPPATISVIEVDFEYVASANDYIRSVACRESWNTLTDACGVESRLNVTPTSRVATYLLVDPSVAKAGSAYDFRSVTLAGNASSTTMDAKGVYVSNSAGQ